MNEWFYGVSPVDDLAKAYGNLSNRSMMGRQIVSKLSLGQAAQLAGVSKSTISRALKNGQISYISRTSSGYEIDPAELFRVFPAKPSETVASERFGTPKETPQEHPQNTEIIQELRRQIDDLRSDRDAWRDQAQRLLLTHEAPPPPPARRRWWWGKDD